MSSTLHNPCVLLKRIFSLREQSSLLLCVDTVAQSAHYLIREFVHQLKDTPLQLLYLSYETANRPSYATQFINCSALSAEEVVAQAKRALAGSGAPGESQWLVVVDSMNYVPVDELGRFVGGLAGPGVTVVATYHSSMPRFTEPALQHYPDGLELLRFMSVTILEVAPLVPEEDAEELEEQLARFVVPRRLNGPVYALTLTNRRKSGRSLSYRFRIDSTNHSYSLLDGAADRDTEQPAHLEGLTTFNLSTTQKQKQAKEKLELPFLEAQSFNTGGAIVYEFEKDDDYDEEDPYEDPF
ncbi:ADR332Wp [Eremothecium gossypii ATCC 10895]|uniref:Elongator complex protein 5 n=1 Tax=Eremothecium gossypii (strain ATCC 10895 / CBS 109.51 / FGSC 9923 / NRRL Y-1056) TaxID=284811 RepID=Q759E5_EREGS|nr:ADR332Wp [Eremothecium gossypii ATCC 10895]AAS52252.1 ADR332Wp [Eremothecium gossypii ATCC 10895]AEY96551.1 FADR332Wp [Eremothecium gossypii FDAG1]